MMTTVMMLVAGEIFISGGCLHFLGSFTRGNFILIWYWIGFLMVWDVNFVFGFLWVGSDFMSCECLFMLLSVIQGRK